MGKRRSVERGDADILEKVKAKRGYTLPFHELFCCVDPVLLEKYDAFYENLTLGRRHLDDKTKELVWLGILIAVSEEAGIIHLERGRKAGITDEEISDVVMLAQVAKGFEALSFLEEKWGEHLPNFEVMKMYDRVIENLTKNIAIARNRVELVLIGVYSALSNKRALRFHLKRAYTHGLRDEEVAEAMSYVFIPCGGNVLIEAAEVIKELVQSRELKPVSSFKIWLPGES